MKPGVILTGMAALLLGASVAWAQGGQDSLPPAPAGKAWKLGWQDKLDYVRGYDLLASRATSE